MARKNVTRIVRSRRISDARRRRDQAIRRKVLAEFPPAPPRPIPASLSKSLKEALLASDLSLYQIAKSAGVSQIVISRFVSGQRDIRMGTADKLAHALRLRLTMAS